MAANITSLIEYGPQCTESRMTIYLQTVLYICRALLLLPPSILILHQARQHWQQQRSFASASHSDVFTYHLSVIELISIVGYVTCSTGAHMNLQKLSAFGYALSSPVVYGEISFHVLTCVERYLAAVHPVTYQGLRNARGVKIRNISTGCVWLLCIVSAAIEANSYPKPVIEIFSCFILSSLLVILFCTLSVLCVLIRPSPGESGKHREKVNRSRKRAVLMMMMISGCLLLSLLGYFIPNMLKSNLTLRQICVFIMTASWLSVPSSLVLPLLFLHRRGLLSCLIRSKTSVRQ